MEVISKVRLVEGSTARCEALEESFEMKQKEGTKEDESRSNARSRGCM